MGHAKKIRRLSTSPLYLGLIAAARVAPPFVRLALSEAGSPAERLAGWGALALLREGSVLDALRTLQTDDAARERAAMAVRKAFGPSAFPLTITRNSGSVTLSLRDSIPEAERCSWCCGTGRVVSQEIASWSTGNAGYLTRSGSTYRCGHCAGGGDEPETRRGDCGCRKGRKGDSARGAKLSPVRPRRRVPVVHLGVSA